MSKQIFLPESLYGVDSKMTHRKLKVFYENSSSITGKVTRLDSANKLFEVDIGGGIIAYMRYTDSTIYPIYKENGELSPNIYDLVGKTIQAKIQKIQSNVIFLSRKENMLEALETIKMQSKIKFASITAFSRLSAFFDIGAGITGRSYAKDFSNTVYNDITDLGVKIGDIISVKILSYLEEDKKFDLSRVATLPSIFDVLKAQDVYTCKVFGPVNDESKMGYFVSVNEFSGIVDSPDVELHYGDEITAIITKVTPKGARLDFVRKI